jgi:hypothetical protein
MSEAKAKVSFSATLEHIQDYNDEVRLDLKSTDEERVVGGVFMSAESAARLGITQRWKKNNSGRWTEDFRGGGRVRVHVTIELEEGEH